MRPVFEAYSLIRSLIMLAPQRSHSIDRPPLSPARGLTVTESSPNTQAGGVASRRGTSRVVFSHAAERVNASARLRAAAHQP